jgi:ATP-binding cassette, subfamily B, bacterial
VGERGVKLSGCQRQRIAIARVLLKSAPILVMDEATSNLDSITEPFIQDKLGEIMEDKTVLVVAHRLSTVAHRGRILVFDKWLGDRGRQPRTIAAPGRVPCAVVESPVQ